VLTIAADSSAWATQLRLLAGALLRRLNEELGHGTVTKVVVHGPGRGSWRRGPLAARDGRGPRDTYG
jgi:predicted nucleic acid-binding Zn ribbon protein